MSFVKKSSYKIIGQHGKVTLDDVEKFLYFLTSYLTFCKESYHYGDEHVLWQIVEKGGVLQQTHPIFGAWSFDLITTHCIVIMELADILDLKQIVVVVVFQIECKTITICVSSLLMKC